MNGAARGWKCAVCGLLISRIEDGWVEWLAQDDERETTMASGLRLVHQLKASPRESAGGCQYDERQEFRSNRSVVEGLPLARFVGPDGLMLLLSFVAAGELPIGDVLELTKRVHIPGYEQSRDLLQESVAEGKMAPAIAEGYYLQSEIRAVLGRLFQIVQSA